ncbi:TonB-dependent receptor domain-containing protein [Sphingomonas sp. 10B4]|uniref:TonB-dependent receptor domain-containing protein n=1 Tax=Sphingomonas sp. 10B4 TaxID=3048575 RepID=UPI002AB57C54|nr:TonB-dependent receptor [Sphingomonas sp. 10B4]MDY7526251.1 TonB-dependent receptor [Sphingomonas sp. 10B4]MEB0283475.1 TonB-dependent receptor [Sphingomonas sp. 10B4]
MRRSADTFMPLAVSLISLLASSAAFAQDQVPATQPSDAPAASAQASAPQATAAPADETEGKAADIVVTGTSRRTTLLRTPYSITTFDRAEIDRRAPSSLADLIRAVPGISAEPSGSAGGGENFFVRGMPAGGTYLTAIQMDGLAPLDEPQESYVNTDQFTRLDLMTERVETVVGGTSPIYATNAVGATINSITRLGTATPGGMVRGTLGSHSLRRIDAYQTGAVNDRLLFSVGGFYRTDDGQREPGYTADKGGQVTGTLSALFANGRIDFIGKYTNDRDAFYTAIPLLNPTTGASLSQYLDPNYGTLASNDFRNVTLRSFYGTDARKRNVDLADGIHTDMARFNINAAFDFGDWHVSDKFGFADGTIDFNAIFSGASPTSAAAYLNSKLAQARAGFGANVARLGYVYANGSNAGSVYDGSSGSGLVIENGLQAIHTKVRTYTDDLRVNRSFETGAIGKIDFTGGLEFQVFHFLQDRSINTILTNVQDQPRALDVAAYDAAGNLLGTVTEDGFVRYNSGLAHGTSDGHYISPYGAFTWHPVEALAIDGGIRHTWMNNDGENWTTANGVISTPGSLAGQVVGGYTGATTIKKDRFEATSWTAGLQYTISPAAQVFGRYTNAVRLPRLQNAFLLQNNPVNKIKLAEGGVKVGRGANFVTATAFYSKYSPLTGNVIVLNSATNTYVVATTRGVTETVGGEFAASVQPVRWFGFTGNLTVQNPKQKSLTFTGITASVPSGNLIVAREPKILINATPTLYGDAFGIPAELSLLMFYVGDRYVDAANTTKLPHYFTLGANVRANITDRVELLFSASNLTNKVGLTEGNPRIDTVSGQGGDIGYARPIFGRAVQASLSYKW